MFASIFGRATLTRPENQPSALKRRDGDPTFDEPWQAQVLGIADAMVASGVIDANAWADRLGAALRKGAETDARDNTETYYNAVLEALESLLAEVGAAGTDELDSREQQWRRAYLNTPHGKPVELTAGAKPSSS